MSFDSLGNPTIFLTCIPGAWIWYEIWQETSER
uniref:Uncharacterized protein n=1 Tax=Triticum urartu TaxID=4572 RepID=A0A8R7PJJ7_TRIUA